MSDSTNGPYSPALKFIKDELTAIGFGEHITLDEDERPKIKIHTSEGETKWISVSQDELAKIINVIT